MRKFSIYLLLATLILTTLVTNGCKNPNKLVFAGEYTLSRAEGEAITKLNTESYTERNFLSNRDLKDATLEWVMEYPEMRVKGYFTIQDEEYRVVSDVNSWSKVHGMRRFNRKGEPGPWRFNKRFQAPPDDGDWHEQTLTDTGTVRDWYEADEGARVIVSTIYSVSLYARYRKNLRNGKTQVDSSWLKKELSLYVGNAVRLHNQFKIQKEKINVDIYDWNLDMKFDQDDYVILSGPLWKSQTLPLDGKPVQIKTSFYGEIDQAYCFSLKQVNGYYVLEIKQAADKPDIPDITEAD